MLVKCLCRRWFRLAKAAAGGQAETARARQFKAFGAIKVALSLETTCFMGRRFVRRQLVDGAASPLHGQNNNHNNTPT